MNKSARTIRGLGEVSIRVRDLDAMHKFYEEVVGLEVAARRGCARRDESFVFFKGAKGYGGHSPRYWESRLPAKLILMYI